MLLMSRLLWRPTSASARVWVGASWFAAQMVALSISVAAVAVLFGAVAAVAAWQVMTRWVSRPTLPSLVIAATAATALPVSAAFGGARLVGGVLLFGVVLSFALADLVRVDKAGRLVRAGWLVQAWFPAGFAASCVVLTASYELGAAVILLWLVAVYDAGEYLVGADASVAYVGPLAGVFGAWIAAFTLVELGIPPLDRTSVWQFGLLATVALPLGPIVGSMVLPSATSLAPMLRRLDSLLVMAPAWAWMIGLLLQDL